MSANFHLAVYAFLAALGIGLIFSKSAERKCDAQLDKLVYRPGQSEVSMRASALWWLLEGLLLATCGALNYLWR